MKLNKFCFFLLVFLFYFSYFMESGGYYEYHLANQLKLTDEKIKQFENDVKEGKSISVDKYLNGTEVDYSNALTKKTSEVSLKLNNYLNKIIRNFFKSLEKLVG